MRNWITILLLLIAGVAAVGGIYARTEKSPKPPLDLQVSQMSESLREQIIPPVGTSKAEVDEIYGEPREVPRLVGKGSPGDYPMHTYQLLDPQGNDEFRAFLHVTYRDERVYRVGINHFRVVKGRLILTPSQSPQITAEIERESRWVLADLLEIYNKYDVTKASWNQNRADH